MAVSHIMEYNKLQKYEPPNWSKSLAYQPESYAQVGFTIAHMIALSLFQLMAFNSQLCVRPTPIHRWDVPGLPKEFQLFIKRDDMTGSTLGGNKVAS